MKAFDTNALQLDPGLVARLAETLSIVRTLRSSRARRADGQ
jgi:hypothetical protein